MHLLCRINSYAIHVKVTQGINVVTRPKAYSYIRMSTAEQAKGDSTRRQYKATTAYADENNLELVEIINDEGVSAFTGSNAEFGKLSEFIAQAKQGKIEKGSFLIVESLDRISRQTLHKALLLFQQINDLGINIVTLNDKKTYYANSVTANPHDLIMAIFTFVRANEESQMKSVRLKASWENKRAIAKTGLNTRHVVPKWLIYSDVDQKIIAIPERASVIKEIFQLSHSGWGAYSIAKKLNEQKLETWGRAKFWQESYIKKIIHNRAVIGEYQPYVTERDSIKTTRSKSGDPIQEYYPKIIESHIFYETQRIVGQRALNGKGRKGGTLANLFSGLIFCDQCNSPMRYIDKGKPPKGGKYLRCTQSILTDQCRSTSYRYPEIEKLIIDSLRQLDTKKMRLDEIHLKLSTELLNRKSELENDIEKISQHIAKLVKMNLSKDLECDEIEDEVRFLSSDKRAKKFELETVLKDIDEIKIPDFDANREIYQTLKMDYKTDFEKKSARVKISSMIRELVRSIIISEDTVYPSETEEKSYKEGKYINLKILYRNGASQILYGADDTNAYMESSEKMKLMKQRISLLERD